MTPSKYARCILVAFILCFAGAAGPGARAQEQLARQVADLTSAWAGSASSSPVDFHTLGGRILFFPLTQESGREPWSTDGTSASTLQLADTCPGACGASRSVGLLAQGVLFVSFSEALQTDERAALWISDGTRPGTRRLMDDTSYRFPFDENAERRLVVFNGKALFGGASPETGVELWTSDGSPEGTARLVDLLPGSRGSNPRGFVEAFGKVTFVALMEPGGTGLWETDGTAAGTAPLPRPPGLRLRDDHLVPSDDAVFFLARRQGVSELGLWRLSPAGTYEELLAPQPQSTMELLAAADDLLYLRYTTTGEGDEIWRSDGTPAGTRPITNLADPFALSVFGAPPRVTPLGPEAVFFAAREDLEIKLFRSDGSPASSGPVPRACAGLPECPPINPSLAFFPFGDHLALVSGFVSTARSGANVEIASRNPGAATVDLATLCGPGCLPAALPLAVLGDELFFQATDESPGVRLWRTDGTAGGTSLVASSPSAQEPARLGTLPLARTAQGWLVPFFESGRGTEPYFADAATGQARLLLDVNRSPKGSNPRNLATAGQQLVFEAKADGRSSSSLWGTAGEAATTEGLPVPEVDLLGGLVESVGDTVVIVFRGSAPDRWELWSSDGTAAGTRQLRAFEGSNGTNAAPTSFAPRGEELAFVRNAVSDSGLWQTDGTAAGTRLELPLAATTYSRLDGLGADAERLFLLASDGAVTDLVALPDGSADLLFLARYGESTFARDGIRQVLDAGSASLLVLCDQVNRRMSLWRTEGTETTTQRLLETVLENPCGPGLPESFSRVIERRGSFYFVTAAEGSSIGLWRTDGTPAGTLPVAEGSGLRDPAKLVAVGGRLVFPLRDEEHGLELWTSDGTAAGTAMLLDLFPGPLSSSPKEFTVRGGTAYFVANDGGHGFELWRTDGSAEGTRLVHDLAPGPDSSSPRDLTLVDGKIYFSADDGLTGRELWMLPPEGSGPPCRASQEALCLKNDRFKVEARWRDFAGRTGKGQAVPLTGDTGTFWFFNEENVETILKVLDGRGHNNHFWTFYGALSNVEYFLTVTDSLTGLTRRYFNPSRTFASVGDTRSFGPLGADRLESPLAGVGFAGPPPEILERRAAPAGACVPGPARLCLRDGRFAVEASWTDFSGNTGVGTAVSLTSDTGYFWFFRDSNVETVLKVLDGRSNNGNFWVFYGSLSNVDFDLTVTDTETGRMKTYLNRNRTFASVGDTAAFPGG